MSASRSPLFSAKHDNFLLFSAGIFHCYMEYAKLKGEAGSDVSLKDLGFQTDLRVYLHLRQTWLAFSKSPSCPGCGVGQGDAPQPRCLWGTGLGKGHQGGLGSSRSLRGPSQRVEPRRAALLDATSATGLSLRPRLLFHADRGVGRPRRSVRGRDGAAGEGQSHPKAAVGRHPCPRATRGSPSPSQ